MAQAAVSPPPSTTPAGVLGGRSASLDAFRGFTMVMLIAEGFGLHYFRGHPVLGGLATQFSHVNWVISIPGDLHFWDLIQPFFMFVVGAVMPFSFSKRWERGETWTQSFGHVLKRCALLIIWGLIARSVQADRPVIDLINVLAQIAFTYFVAFLLLRKSWRVQGAAALGLLAASWAIYQFISAPGVLGPWVKDANIGEYWDLLILHKTWSGSYATINCISSAANTIFGVMAGELLRSALPAARKMRILALTGIGGIVIGFAMSPAVPMIKKIWTVSFTFYSTGMTLLALLFFYWLFDVKQKRPLGKLFLVVGSNSIFIYLVGEILGRWLEGVAAIFTGWAVNWWGAFGHMLGAWLVIAFEIYLCFWLYRRKIFFKL